MHFALAIGLIYPFTYCIFQALTRGIIKVPALYIVGILLMMFSFVLINGKVSKILPSNFSVFLLYGIIIICMLTRGNQMLSILLEYIFAMACCLMISKTDKWAQTLYKILVIIGLFYSLTVIIQALRPDQFYSFARPLFPELYQEKFIFLKATGYNSGLTTQVAIVCCYIMLGFSVLFANIYVDSVENKKRNFLHVALLLISVSAILLSGKRAALVFSFFSVMIFCFFAASNLGKRFKILFGVSIAAFLVYSIGIPLIESYFSELFPTVSRLITLMESGDIGNGRYYYWNLGIELIKKYPMLGVGWENYITESGARFNCHNIYIQLLAELGIPIGSAVIALMIIIWNKTRVLLQKCVHSGNEHIYKVAICFSFLTQTYLLSYGFAGNPLYDPEYIAFYFISIMSFAMVNYFCR